MELMWFVENGCELQKPNIEMLAKIHQVSGGNPCSGCNCKKTCPAWPKLVKINNAATKGRTFSSLQDHATRCPKCQCLVNRSKAARRYDKNPENVKFGRRSNMERGICACGAHVSFN